MQVCLRDRTVLLSIRIAQARNQRPDPYVAAVDAIGDSWTFLVIREAFFGAHRFEEFGARLRISRARLTERLRHLVESGILAKVPIRDGGARKRYRITEKGSAIYPIALALLEWGARWRPIPNTVKLTHEPCGRRLKPSFVCRACGLPITHRDIDWPEMPNLGQAALANSDVRSWRRMASFDDVSDRPDHVEESLKAFGDRWSMLLMYGALHGSFQFVDAESKLGLASNILSHRLKHLTEQGLLAQRRQPRSEYAPTAASLAMAPVVVAARTWAIDWVDPAPKRWAILRHRPCGNDLRLDAHCTACDRVIVPHDVGTRSPPPTPRNP